MTEPTSTADKIRALTAERKRRKADMRERQRRQLLAAIAKAEGK